MLILTNKSLTKMSSEIQPWSEKPKGKLKWSLKKGKFLASLMYVLWFIFIHGCNFIYLFLTWQCMIVSLKWNWIEYFQLLHILLVTGDFIQLTRENFELPFRHNYLTWYLKKPYLKNPILSRNRPRVWFRAHKLTDVSVKLQPLKRLLGWLACSKELTTSRQTLHR